MQQIMGTFLYYSRAIDSAMLVALSMLAAFTQNFSIIAPQTQKWQSNSAGVLWSFKCIVIHPTIQNPMPAATLGVTTTGQQVGGGSLSHPGTPQWPNFSNNRCTMGCCLPLGQRQWVYLEMGHDQPATPIQVDNSTALAIANNTIKQQWS